ncbi:hypothetical protein SDJN02_24331, partial [Cucurbita argyrosperma subsp. argyrosperma]
MVGVGCKKPSVTRYAPEYCSQVIESSTYAPRWQTSPRRGTTKQPLQVTATVARSEDKLGKKVEVNYKFTPPTKLNSEGERVVQVKTPKINSVILIGSYNFPSPMANKTASSSRLCLCAPTSHPGSFRCSLHRRPRKASDKTTLSRGSQSKAATATSTATGLFKVFLMQAIKPSSHDLRRRNFQPKPSRFCNAASDHRLEVSSS